MLVFIRCLLLCSIYLNWPPGGILAVNTEINLRPSNSPESSDFTFLNPKSKRLADVLFLAAIFVVHPYPKFSAMFDWSQWKKSIQSVAVLHFDVSELKYFIPVKNYPL